jgi:hypothetical protein
MLLGKEGSEGVIYLSCGILNLSSAKYKPAFYQHK